MFYSINLLQGTGPLAKVWVAGGQDRKLGKSQILASSVPRDVKEIISPSGAPMALRLTSKLLLGVVKIYSRKTRYLLDDCNEALVKIKMVSITTAAPC